MSCIDSEFSGKCTESKCECTKGYIGDDCSLYDGNSKEALGNTWHKSTRLPHGGRTGQCSVFAEELGAILTYGGFNLTAVSGELLEYKFSIGEWKVHDKENKIFVKLDQMRGDDPKGNLVKIGYFSCFPA